MKRLSIRWRLTLWYGTVLSAILVGFSGAVYLLMRHHLLALTDAALAEELAEFAGDVARCESPEALPRELGLRYAQPRGLRVPGEHRGGRDPVPQRRARPATGCRSPVRRHWPRRPAVSPASLLDRLGHCAPGRRRIVAVRAGRSSSRPPSRWPPTTRRCGSC